LMDRIERLADLRGETSRELMTRLMTTGVMQLERDSGAPATEAAHRANGDGAHA
jgi:hypothetical protein